MTFAPRKTRNRLLLALFLLCGLGLLLYYFRAQPTTSSQLEAPETPAPALEVPEAPAPNLTPAVPQVQPAPPVPAPQKPKPAEPVAQLDYPHWGGALTSASKNGDGFFDAPRAWKFREDLRDHERYIIQLHSRAILPDPLAKAADVVDGRGEQTVLVQFHEPPSQARKDELARQGVVLVDYMSGTAWSARGGGDALSALRADPGVRGMSKLDPRDKLSPVVYEGAPTLTDRDLPRYVLLAHPGSQMTDFAGTAQLVAANLKDYPTSVLGPRFVLYADRTGIEALAALSRTSYIEPYPGPPKSRDANTDAQANVPAVRDTGRLLDGTGVTVAVREVDRIKPVDDYIARFTDRNSGSTGQFDVNHATAVAGVVGGDGTSGPKGVAPNVTILGYDLDGPPGNDDFLLTTDLVDAVGQGARVSNHSYGPTGTANSTYTSNTANWDAAARANELVVIFAGGEDGPPSPTRAIDFLCAGKNNIDVTAAAGAARAGDATHPPVSGLASLTPGNSSFVFVNFGPMRDGRVKPDCAANGEHVLLLKGNTNLSDNSATTQFQSGTSFAAPAVAGMTALLFQYYKSKFGNAEPTSALTKALLLNTATNFGSPGPNAKYGFGIVNIQKACDMIDAQLASPANDKVWYEDSVTTNVTKTFTFTIGTQSELKILLAWMDYFGNPASTISLVNDLDLEVIEPNGTHVLPYHLNPSPGNPLSAGTNLVRNSVDNVEQVDILSPPPGTYTILVTGFNVPQGPQSFAVVSSRNVLTAATLSVTAVDQGTIDATNHVTYLPAGGATVTLQPTVAGGTEPYQVDYDFTSNGSTDHTESDSLPLPSLAALYPGGAFDFTTKVTVTDALLATASATTLIRVLDVPTAVASAGGSTSGTAPLSTSFSSTGSTANPAAGDLDGIALLTTYTWTVTDNSDSSTLATLTGTSPSFTFEKAGSFNVTLVVTDKSGQQSIPSAPVVYTVSKRALANTGAHFTASVTFAPASGYLTMVLNAADYNMPPSQGAKLFASGFFLNKPYTVKFNPGGTHELDLAFTLNRFGYQRTAAAALTVQPATHGQIVVQYHTSTSDIANMLADLGMDSTPASASNPKVPATFKSVPVQIVSDDATYDATFSVIWQPGSPTSPVQRGTAYKP